MTCTPPVCAAGPGPGSHTSHSPGPSVVTVLTPPVESYDAATAAFVPCTYAYRRPAPLLPRTLTAPAGPAAQDADRNGGLALIPEPSALGLIPAPNIQDQHSLLIKQHLTIRHDLGLRY
jgi:hypothetical protein